MINNCWFISPLLASLSLIAATNFTFYLFIAQVLCQFMLAIILIFALFIIGFTSHFHVFIFSGGWLSLEECGKRTAVAMMKKRKKAVDSTLKTFVRRGKRENDGERGDKKDKT